MANSKHLHEDDSDDLNAELEQMKKEMVRGKAVFVNDLHTDKIRNHEPRYLQVEELERTLQAINEHMEFAGNPGARSSLTKLKMALSESPELIPYVIIKLKDDRRNLSSLRDLEKTFERIEKTVREYQNETQKLSGPGLSKKLKEFGDVRSKIVRILESENTPESGIHQIRYRIATSQSGDMAMKNLTEPPPSSKARDAIRKYLPKLNGFITHLTESPKEIRIDHIGYNMRDYELIKTIVEKLEK